MTMRNRAKRFLVMAGFKVQTDSSSSTGLFPRMEKFSPSVKRLHELGSLPLDWNSYGGAPASYQAIASGLRILQAVAFLDLRRPSEWALPFVIAPLPDGGIHMEWRKRADELTIEVHPDGSTGFLAIESRCGEEKADEVDQVQMSELVRHLSWILADD